MLDKRRLHASKRSLSLLLLFWCVAGLLLLMLLFGVSSTSPTSKTAAGQPRITKAATADGCVYWRGYIDSLPYDWSFEERSYQSGSQRLHRRCERSIRYHPGNRRRNVGKSQFQSQPNLYSGSPCCKQNKHRYIKGAPYVLGQANQLFSALIWMAAHCKKLPLDATLFCLRMEIKYTIWDWLTICD